MFTERMARDSRVDARAGLAHPLARYRITEKLRSSTNEHVIVQISEGAESPTRQQYILLIQALHGNLWGACIDNSPESVSASR